MASITQKEITDKIAEILKQELVDIITVKSAPQTSIDEDTLLDLMTKFREPPVIPYDEIRGHDLPIITKAFGIEKVDSTIRSPFGSIMGVPIMTSRYIPPNIILGVKYGRTAWDRPQLTIFEISDEATNEK